jgi:hypothetical protein
MVKLFAGSREAEEEEKAEEDSGSGPELIESEQPESGVKRSRDANRPMTFLFMVKIPWFRPIVEKGLLTKC